MVFFFLLLVLFLRPITLASPEVSWLARLLLGLGRSLADIRRKPNGEDLSARAITWDNPNRSLRVFKITIADSIADNIAYTTANIVENNITSTNRIAGAA